MKLQRMEITVETEVSVSVRGAAAAVELCALCGGLLLTPEAAARIASTSVRAIYRWVDAGGMHFTEGQGRGVRVCDQSLRNR